MTGFVGTTARKSILSLGVFSGLESCNSSAVCEQPNSSFLTSFFALNVSDFPHSDDNLEFQEKLIFPFVWEFPLA